MCGKPALTIVPIQTSLKVPERSAQTSIARTNIPAVGPITEEKHWRRNSALILVAAVVVFLVPVFLVVRDWQKSEPTESVARIANVPSQAISTENAPLISPFKSRTKVIRSSALEKVETAREKLPNAATVSTTPTISSTQNDPAELWKNVRAGDAHAEVTLAKLYLAGDTVPQNCEQTHLLLLAASKKGYKPAESLLTGEYVERCQPTLNQ